jgi:hypothetical protein
MKKLIPCLLLFLGSFTVPQIAKAQYASVSFQVFYDELSPYGMWVNNPTYGYVWVPSVAVGFRPYATDGYWVYSDAGWTWVSYYSWGWAPFHYGRWFYDPFYGYVWVPGTDWGPAWVSWRHCDGYYGWTALGPGISWGVGYTTYNPPAERWIFVREHDFGRKNINNYYVNQSNNVTIINQSTVINNTIINKQRNETYIAGPDKAAVQKTTGKAFNPVPVRDVQQKGFRADNNQVSAYRPKVEVNTERKAAPTKVYNEKEAKPLMDKKSYGGKAAGTTPAVKTAPAPAERRTNVRENQPGLERRDMPNNKVPVNEPKRDIRTTDPNRVNPAERRDNMKTAPERVNPQQKIPVQREERRDFNQPRSEPQRIQPNENREPVQPRNDAPQKIDPQQQMPEQRRVNPNNFEQPRQMEPPQNRPERINPEPQRPQQFNQPQRMEPQRINPNPQPMQQPHMQQPQRLPVNPGGGGKIPH